MTGVPLRNTGPPGAPSTADHRGARPSETVRHRQGTKFQDRPSWGRHTGSGDHYTSERRDVGSCALVRHGIHPDFRSNGLADDGEIIGHARRSRRASKSCRHPTPERGNCRVVSKGYCRSRRKRFRRRTDQGAETLAQHSRPLDSCLSGRSSTFQLIANVLACRVQCETRKHLRASIVEDDRNSVKAIKAPVQRIASTKPSAFSLPPAVQAPERHPRQGAGYRPDARRRRQSWRS